MSKDETSHVFSGNFDDCWKHFVKAMSLRYPKGSRGVAKARKPLAEFCNVDSRTPDDWFNRNVMPIGGQWIKVAFFLEINGYRVRELVRVDQSRRNFMELIGYDIISGAEATSALGYAHSASLYSMLRGEHEALQSKQDKMYEMWKQRKELLERKKTEACERYVISLSDEDAPDSRVSLAMPAQLSDTQSSAKSSPLHGGLVFQIITLLLSALEGANGAISIENLAPAEKDTILRLSSRLSELSAGIMRERR